MGEGFGKLGISSRQEPMNGFGITVDNEMAIIPARILPAPRLSYKGGQPPRVSDGSWYVLFNTRNPVDGLMGLLQEHLGS